MRGKHSSWVFFRSEPGCKAQSASGFRRSFNIRKTRPVSAMLGVLAASVYFGTVGLSWGDPPEVAANMDCSLQKLALHAKQTMPEAQVAGVHSQIAKIETADKEQIRGRWDANDRVLVHVLLDGQSTLDEVAEKVQAIQGNVVDRAPNYRHGLLAAYVPTDQLENIAKIGGVRALAMEHRPEVRVGKVTSQGVAVLETDKLNARGLKGDGITVGVLSDSFNTAYQNTQSPPATTAAQDVATGDLPVVKILKIGGVPQDFPNGTDEGRAICQIIYDEAPHCHLAFATAFNSEISFAQNIVALRTQEHCDIIDDDIGYFDEPVFSDGFVAEAVNTVVNSKTLPGQPVIYTSSAGNDGNNGYRNFYRNLSDQEVRQAGNHGNLKLISNPKSPNYLNPALTAGGWYNWNPNGGTEPVTTVSAPGPADFSYDLFLQWDDLFDRDHGITTDYNFLVFDQDGNYLPKLSGTSKAFAMQQPFQGIGDLSLGTTYQIAITKTTQTDPKAGKIPPTHQLAIYSTLDGASNLTGPYFNPNPPAVPNIIGHPGAESAIAVAAYAFSWKPKLPYQPQLDNFTSPGPVTIYFDANGNRLSVPETRLKPEVAGVDGVITTFFAPPAYYNYPFAFFGTSASAPSVAGVVALMLQEAGGPDSLNADTVRSALENSAQPRTSTPEMSQGIGANSSGFVGVTALGQAYFGTHYLTFNYLGVPGQSVDTLTIDGSGAGLVFDTTAFAVGATIGVNSSDVKVSPKSTATSKFTLTFKNGTFTSGATISFTLGEDVAGTFLGLTAPEFGVGSDAEELGSGGAFTVKFGGTAKNSVSAPIQNGPPTLGYSPFDGFGLINAIQAVQQITPASIRK
jgi:hypothetical protein